VNGHTRRDSEERAVSDRIGGEVRVERDGATLRFKNGQAQVTVSAWSTTTR
jgi:hypothetical protein